MDPLSLIALGAAVGGGAGKFVEKAWDSGEKWIQTYFKDHREISQKQATENSLNFLTELAHRVKQLEDEKIISKEMIDQAQDHPDFSTFLQKALLTSAQTDSKDKHKLLARLVSERLTSQPESVFSLASKKACDALSFTSMNQIILLGLLSNLYIIRPTPFPPVGLTPDKNQEWMDIWVTKQLIFFKNFTVGKQDINHLESLSFITKEYGKHNLMNLYKQGDFRFDFNLLKNSDLKLKIQKLWFESRLDAIILAPIGQIVGILASDLITNNQTSFDDWE